MSLAILQDLPREPVNYSAEFRKYLELILKYTPITTVGDYSWTSPSSNILYTALNGEQSLINAIESQINSYVLNSNKWNNIEDFISESLSYVYADLEETRSLVERQLGADIFVNKTGYGGYTLFDSLSDKVIDSGNTTATVDTANKKCTWSSAGTQILKLLSNQFNNNFSGIRVRISGGFNSGIPQANYTNTNSVSLTLPNYSLTTSDKIYAYSTAISKYKEIGITNVTGGSITIDKTTPISIVNSGYYTGTRPKYLQSGKIIKCL